jgi:hypothetical protein
VPQWFKVPQLLKVLRWLKELQQIMALLLRHRAPMR